jgi:carbon-monoxide dehydrogenase small subunit
MLDGHRNVDLHFGLNGKKQTLNVSSSLTLVELLRVHYGLTGAKVACSQAVCGSCTVIVDGRPVASCARFAFQIDGSEIVTIEGLSGDPAALHPIQQSFLSCGAFQCGYCTSGMIMLAKALLDEEPDPDPADVREWMSSNICRCTGYEQILEAVMQAGRLMREAKGQ